MNIRGILLVTLFLASASLLFGQVVVRPHGTHTIAIKDLAQGTSRIVTPAVKIKNFPLPTLWRDSLLVVNRGVYAAPARDSLEGVIRYALLDPRGNVIRDSLDGALVYASPEAPHLALANGGFVYEANNKMTGLSFYTEVGTLVTSVIFPFPLFCFAETAENPISYAPATGRYRIGGNYADAVRVFEIDPSQTPPTLIEVKDGFLVSDDGRYSANGKLQGTLYENGISLKTYSAVWRPYDDDDASGASCWLKGRDVYFIKKWLFDCSTGRWIDSHAKTGYSVNSYDRATDRFICWRKGQTFSVPADSLLN